MANLEGAIRFYKDAFGLEVERRVEDPDRDLRAAFLRWGGVSIEAIQVGRDAEDGNQNLDSGRIDHIAIAVDDLDAELKAVLEAGGKQEGSPTVRSGRRSVFIDKTSACGIGYQLVQALASE